MKKILFVILVIFVISNWNEVSNFVAGNASVFNVSMTHWLVDHTPKQ